MAKQYLPAVYQNTTAAAGQSISSADVNSQNLIANKFTQYCTPHTYVQHSYIYCFITYLI